MFAALLGGVKAVGGSLAKSGIIRGSVGKLLGGGTKSAGTAITGPIMSQLPVPISSAPNIIGKVLRGGTSIAGAVGASVIAGKLTGMGGGQRKRRRINYGNTRALNRSLRRVEGFTKLVKRSFSIAGDLKPRKRRSCR